MKIIVYILIVLGLSLYKSHAQYPILSKAYPDNLQKQYYNKDLDAKAYLDSTTELFYRNITTGHYFEGEYLLKYLNLYKKIAWSSEKYLWYRSTYYLLLASNARSRNRLGESRYYCEKINKEQKLQGSSKPLNVLIQICNIHATNKSYKKAIEAYQKEKNYINQFPNLLKHNSLSTKDAVNIFYVFMPVLYSSVSLKDTLLAREVLLLSNQISIELFRKIPKTSEDGAIVNFFIKGMNFIFYHVLLKDPLKSLEYLTETQNIINAPSRFTKEWKSMFNTYFFDWACDYYLKTQKNDSAEVYIRKYEMSPNITYEQTLKINEYKAALLNNLGRSTMVYPVMSSIIEAKDSLTGSMMQEMDELLYAHTQAENDRNDLLIAEEQKKRKNQIIAGITVLSLLIIWLLYSWNRIRERSTRKRIEQLNRIATLQISELEEIKENERRLEQERLGRELHDQLASSVASVKFRLEAIANQDDVISHVEIDILKDQVEEIYTAVRDKSHRWSSEYFYLSEKSFEERIKSLTAQTLPNKIYQKTIEIDDNVLNGLTIEDKIEILHIVQEAITNILKHARASRVTILLFDDGDEKILLIEDNGRGFDVEKENATHDGLGFKSIRTRAKALKGTFKVESSENTGTILRVIMPN